MSTPPCRIKSSTSRPTSLSAQRRHDRRAQAEAAPQPPRDVVLAAALPDPERAGVADPTLARIEAQHHLAERDDVVARTRLGGRGASVTRRSLGAAIRDRLRGAAAVDLVEVAALRRAPAATIQLPPTASHARHGKVGRQRLALLIPPVGTKRTSRERACERPEHRGTHPAARPGRASQRRARARARLSPRSPSRRRAAPARRARRSGAPRVCSKPGETTKRAPACEGALRPAPRERRFRRPTSSRLGGHRGSPRPPPGVRKVTSAHGQPARRERLAPAGRASSSVVDHDDRHDSPHEQRSSVGVAHRREPPAIDGDDRAADVVRRGRGEEDGRAREIVGLAPASGRDPLENLAAPRRIRPQRRGVVGRDVARRDRVDVHTMGRPLVRERTHEADDPDFEAA